MRRRGRGRLGRRWTVIAVSTAVSAALVSGIGGPATEWTARAASYPVRPVAAIEQSPSTIGIAEGHDMYLMSDADIARTLDAMQALGVQNVRIGIFWAGVEAEEGVFNWENVDRMVDAATLRGMGILGTILYTPQWAGATQPPETTEWASHPDPVKFGNFVGEVAEKYEGRISSYEIWNEPTAGMFWNPVDPEAYTDILKAGYRAIKAVDPSAVVIAGSVVAGPTYADGSSLSPVDFIEGMYDSGAKGYFDAISYHPYLYTMSFSNGAHQADQFDYPIEQLDEIRNLMIAKGDGHLKVWITEYGQPTNTVYQNSTLTEQQQAAYIEDLLRTWQHIEGAGPVFIYQTRDTATGNGDPDDNLGIYDTDWNRKPVADILEALLDEFNPPDRPAHPMTVFLQRLVHTIGQVLTLVPNLITQVVKAVVRFAGSVLGIRRAGPAPGTATASSGAEPEATDAVSPVAAGRTEAVVAPTAGTGEVTDAVERVAARGVRQARRHSAPDSEPADRAEKVLRAPSPDADESSAETEPAHDDEPDPDVTQLSTEPETPTRERDLDARDASDDSDAGNEPATSAPPDREKVTGAGGGGAEQRSS